MRFGIKGVVVLALLVAALSPIPASRAASAFDDVSESHTFVDDIAWLAGAGITKGCNPPDNTRFCPDNNVTRGQMAAFLHRAIVGQYARWSDPSTWGGSLPTAGSAVTIPSGKTVLLDVSPPPLDTLHIDGTLVFDDRDLNLTADAIMVRGALEVGKAANPYTANATITLTGTDPGRDVGMGMGAKVLGVAPGGIIDLHGTPQTVTWTRLAATAAAGASTITLAEPVTWEPA